MSTAAKCINCQVLGMQKAVDLMLSINQDKAIELARALNKYILYRENFKSDAAHLLDVRKDANGKFHTILTSKKHGPDPRTKERLISLFTMDFPYALQYKKLGNEGQSHEADLPVLKELMKEGLVRIAYQDRKTITYLYTPPHHLPVKESKAQPKASGLSQPLSKPQS